MEENIIVRTDPKVFCLNFDWLKYFIIKKNESLAKGKIKSEIEKLLLKYKHGNNIHEHSKQQNKCAAKICS